MFKKTAIALLFALILAAAWSLAQDDSGKTQPAEGEAKPAEGEAKPAEGEAKPAEGEAKPAEGEVKPAEGEAKPAEGEAKPAEGEKKSAEGEAKPAEGEAKPAEGEAKPAEGEKKPAEGEAKPAEGEAKPAEGEKKPAEGETKPAEVEPKPAEGEKKPAEGEAKPSEGQPEPALVEIPDEVAKLLPGLKAADAKEREAAVRSLVSMGMAIVPALKAAAAKEPDGSAKESILMVAEEIEDGDSVKMADNLYSIDVKEWQASRIYRAFFRKGDRGIPYDLERDSMIALKVEGLSYFQALDAVLAETGCYLWGADQSLGPRVRSLPEAFVKKYLPIVAYGKDSRLQVLGLSRKKPFYPPGSEGGLSLSGWLTVQPGLRIEPGRRFGGTTEVEYSATDDTGAELAGGLATVRERGPGSFFVQLSLKEPAPEAKIIAKLAVGLKASVIGAGERLVLDDVKSKAGGDAADLGGMVKIKVASVGEKDVRFEVSGRGCPRTGFMGTIAAMGSRPDEVLLEGQGGEKPAIASYTIKMAGDRTEYLLELEAPLPAAFNLVYFARAERREEVFSFEFAGIQLSSAGN